ncbi:DNA-processing protein DprA [Bdellovibrio sp. HCB337]|uniref:DNA-processing protein DprA n=1 Tax=Bdellovibrio sp. HCB337 TaxID=3394358 RepID=UPI0039A667B8
MEKLIHLSLIQKNIRCLQSFRRLRDDILPYPLNSEELRRYLRAEEPFFFQEFCESKETLKKEREEIVRLHDQGVKFTFCGDRLYPPSFVGMPGAPVFLSYKGHPAWLWGRSLSVVGSRDITALSQRWMEEHLSEFLRQEKAILVSGGARGVDQVAHQLALRNSNPTVVVLPSGLGAIYPQNLEAWQSKVIDGGGCMMSEYPFAEKMKKHFFHDRNRLIAGLGIVTLLIEARRRSGSLLTAHKSLQLGKSVLVVPGHPSDSSHLGNLDLLSEGATPIRDAEDLGSYFRSELQTLPNVTSMASEL